MLSNFHPKLPACALLLCALGCTSARRFVELETMYAAPCRTAVQGVAWAGPSQREDRTRLSAWCESVGPAMIAAAPDTPFSADLSPDGLAIVTWNIHEGGGDLEQLVAYVRRGRRETTAGPHMVILLQEVARADDDVPHEFPEAVRAPGRIRPKHAPSFDITAVATKLGMSLSYVPSMRNGRSVERGQREDRGSAILSTLPLSDVVGIELPWVSQRRVAVMATVTARRNGEPWRMRVVNAHLDNRPGRAAQADALARFVATRPDPQAPTVVGGDLNAWFGAHDGAVRRIDDVIARVRECGDGPTFQLGLRLDHLFTTLPAVDRAGCEVARDFFGSDHRPIVLCLF